MRELLEVSESSIGAGGFYNIDVVFPQKPRDPSKVSKASEEFNSPLEKAQLQQLGEFEQLLRKTALVKNVSSVVTFIQSVQRIYRGHSGLPSTAKQAEQALLTWERLFGGQRSQWYAKEAGSLRLLVQVKQASSQENIAHMQEVRQLARPSISSRSCGRTFGWGFSTGAYESIYYQRFTAFFWSFIAFCRCIVVSVAA